LAFQKAVEASPVVVDAILSIKKIHKKKRAPVATQKAGGMSPAAVNTKPPGRADKERVAPVAAQEVGTTLPTVEEAGAPCGQEDEEMAAPVAA
jgi:hypothetical protein